MPQPLVVLATGDLIIDEPDPDRYFDPARARLGRAGFQVACGLAF